MNDYISTKLAIYESCDAGYITESEKADLLEILEASKEENSNSSDKKEQIKQLAKNIAKTVVIITSIIAVLQLIKVANDAQKSHKEKVKKEFDTNVEIHEFIGSLHDYKVELSKIQKECNDLQNKYKKASSDHDTALMNTIDEQYRRLQSDGMGIWDKVWHDLQNNRTVVSKFGTRNQIVNYNELLDKLCEVKPNNGNGLDKHKV